MDAGLGDRIIGTTLTAWSRLDPVKSKIQSGYRPTVAM